MGAIISQDVSGILSLNAKQKLFDLQSLKVDPKTPRNGDRSAIAEGITVY